MRLGLIIERKNYYRLLAPVVEAALSRGWEVVCLHDHAQPRTGFKGYEFPDAGIVPSFRSGRPRVEIYQGAAALRDAIVRADVGAVVSLGLPPEPMRSEPATRPAAWVTLQYHAELFSWLAPPGVLSVDALGIYSTWWLDTAADYFVREGVMTSGSAMERQLRNRAAVVGFPELDQISAIDPDEVRRRWKLPRGRPVVLLLPYPFQSNPRSPWSRWAYGGGNRTWRRLRLRLAGHPGLTSAVVRGWDDPGVSHAVRAFCDANAALLVVKARMKDPMPDYLGRLADLTLYDESHYPATILEALAISSLCIHFYSTAVMEAAAAGVPSLSICPEFDEMGITPDWQQSFYVREEESLFQFRGVSETVAVPDVIERLPRQRLGDFAVDADAREAYAAKFFGALDGKSGHRLLDLVEATPRGTA